MVSVPCVIHHKRADEQTLDMALPPEDFCSDYLLQLDHSYRHKTWKTPLLRHCTSVYTIIAGKLAANAQLSTEKNVQLSTSKWKVSDSHKGTCTC